MTKSRNRVQKEPAGASQRQANKTTSNKKTKETKTKQKERNNYTQAPKRIKQKDKKKALQTAHVARHHPIGTNLDLKHQIHQH